MKDKLNLTISFSKYNKIYQNQDTGKLYISILSHDNDGSNIIWYLELANNMEGAFCECIADAKEG